MTNSEQGHRSARAGYLGDDHSKHRGSFLDRILRHLRKATTAIAPLTYRYESPRRLFGLPLLSINLGPDTPDGAMRQAKGIVAIGTNATGILALGVFSARGVFTMAFLSLGLAGVSIGGIGLLTVSVFGIGLASVSVVAVGYLAVGILAVGIKVVGIIAVGLEAVGIVAIGSTTDAVFPIAR